MKKLLIVLLAVFACATAAANDVEVLSEEDWNEEMQENVAVDTHDQYGLILNSQAKKVFENVLKQMPCGFPRYGIPPVAPYTNANLKLHLARSVVDSLLQMIRFRFDGLDKMEVRELKVSYTFSKKVKFHFNFKELKATAQLLDSNTFLDFMKELGISVRYEGKGPLRFSLQNLSLKGQFKYKMPFIFGSIKIYKFQCVVNLGGVYSGIGGMLGNGRMNRAINEQIENMIPALINGHQEEISTKIEQAFVPFANEKMQGKKFWFLVDQIASLNSKCLPPPEPWMLAEEEAKEDDF